MGTRNLTMVVSGKQTKVAQYGQWDHYPEGQGWTILKFLRRVNLKRFKERVDALRFITEADEKPINDYIKAFQEKNGKKWGHESWGKYGWLSRDICGQILTAIMGNPVRHYDINSGKYKRHEYTVKFVQDNGKILAKGGKYSTTDELCRNVDKSANAHSNYRQPAFCQYIVSC